MLTLPTEKGYYVYILECNNHSYYTGWTNDLNARYLTHKEGKGAKYTKAHPPIACVYYESYEDQSTAMKREYEIKQMSRQQKESLIQAMKKHRE